MYNKAMLSLDQAQAAIAAMIDDFNKAPGRRKIDMAVVDDAGNLLAYARMDRCLRPTFAMRKAYTSAVRGMDTAAFAEQLKTQGRSLESFGDPQLIALAGGVVVMYEGAVVGAIGVGGLPSGLDDEAIAKVGVQALNL
ncbi:GlcG/HbpS family heme-binding protein [Candidatus Entotheonella palauensis]|uniref:GlcG/HbpS family heme-binding protein n=1 Tax=Candidatus Entotheonella palauensis TaxID=93172 RepID=UPI000B801BEB|nr:heme-binding protein [Candidatus Entotheonella palauensis]